ncbi:O-antigen polymerase [Citrobacter portucalensis]|uniref:O-antigen polymerase n=1 Tax=Citrobacter portucalensis TaxID=1639133 RepID=UPI0023B05D57|nr:O-antigen polymerase [Citrobacter portucalensis]
MDIIIIALLQVIMYVVFITFLLRSGVVSNLPVLFILLIFIIWQLITPFYGYIHNYRTFFYLDIYEYYMPVMINYMVNLLFFIIGFISVNKTNINKNFIFSDRNYVVSIVFVRMLLIISLTCYILWGITSGKSLSSIFLVDFIKGNFGSVNTNEVERGNVYLLSLIGFITPAIFMAYFSEMKIKEFMFWLIIATVIYTSQGYRYRILLLGIGLLFLYMSSTKVNYKKYIKLILISIISITLLMQLANIRNEIRASQATASFSEESTTKSEYSKWFVSTRNYIAFASLLKYMDEHNLEHGYGETMFLHIFIRAVPSSFFPSNHKPVPPALIVSADSWGSIDGFMSGEAYGCVAAAYYEFGFFGIIIISLIFGAIVAVINRKWAKDNSIYSRVLITIITVSLFQYITRGYLPGFVMTIGFMVLPMFFLRKNIYFRD